MKNRTAKTTTIDPSQKMPSKRSNATGNASQKMPAKKSNATGDPSQKMSSKTESRMMPNPVEQGSISKTESYADMANRMADIKERVAYAKEMMAQERYNRTPFRNNAIDLFDRKRYDISREFDGQEVEGTLMERPTAGGGRVEVERFNDMPGGGRRMERTRFNAEGMPVNRTVRDRGIN